MAFFRQGSMNTASVRQLAGDDELTAVMAAGDVQSPGSDVDEVELAELRANTEANAASGVDTYEAMMFNRSEPMEEENNCWTHGFTRSFCTAKWFTVFLCGYVIVQSMLVTGLFASSVSTLERRYELSSVTTGALAATYDIVFLCFATFVGYHGGRGHSPRWLGVGLIMLLVGALVFLSAEFMGSEYQAARFFALFCFASNDDDPTVCSGGPSVTWILFFGMALMAIGSTPLYTLGPAYLDNVVKRKVLPLYLGFFYACSALGPAFGFALGYLTLGVWVRPGGEPDGIDEDDPFWVGAWWLGYAVAALIGIWFAVPLLMYPKWIPNTSDIRRHNRQQHRLVQGILVRSRSIAGMRIGGTGVAEEPTDRERLRHEWWISKSFRRSVRGTLKNRPFMFNSAAQALEAFAVTGFAAFLPKAGEAVFRISASDASLRIGLVLIPGAAGGIFFGGWLMRRLKATPLQQAKFTFGVSLIALLLLPGILIGCGTLPLQGVTVGEPGILSACNTDCRCDADRYKPVCGSDGINYFSACHAGCDTVQQDCADPSIVTESRCTALRTCQWNAAVPECVQSANFTTGDFFSCSCFDGGQLGGAGAGGLPNYVTEGRCNRDCDRLGAFLIMLFFIMFFTFMNNVPATTVILRVLKYDQRAVGLGLQNVIFRLLGSIPGPIVFGLVLDSVCVLQTRDCGEAVGSCNEYDTEDLRLYFFLLAFCSKILSCTFFFLSWKTMERPEEELKDDLRRPSFFTAVDRVGRGAVSEEDIIEFVRVERFLGNDLFTDVTSLKEYAQDLVATIDTNNDGLVQRREVAAWIRGLTRRQRREVANAVTHVTEERRAAAIDRVFRAIDVNKDGRVTRDEVLYWLRHEQAWRDKTDELIREDKLRSPEDRIFDGESAEQIRADLVREIAGAEGDVTRDDLANYFQRFTVRDMAYFTEDQRFYHELQRHASGDGPGDDDDAADAGGGVGGGGGGGSNSDSD